jgi:hypothetical protein
VAHSPVLRCRETAEALVAGAGRARPSIVDGRLGAPGLFIEDESQASERLATLGVVAVMRALMAGKWVAGFVPPADGARAMLDHIVTPLRVSGPGVLVFVTHDMLLAPMLGWLFGAEVDLPGYLDGLLAWKDAQGRTWVRGAGRERVLS